MLGFEFVVLANHDKKLSLFELERCSFKSKTKSYVQDKERCNLPSSIDDQLMFDQSKEFSIDQESSISKN